MILQLFTIACSLAIPYLLGGVIHGLEIQNVNLNSLIRSFLVLILVYLLWDIAGVMVDINFEKINKGVENDLREYCYSKILNSPMAKIQGKSEGEIITKVIRDTEKIEKTFSSIFKFSNSVIHSFAIIVMMLIVNPLLASIILSLFSVIVIVHRSMAKPLKSLYGQYKSSEENLLTDLRNQIAGFLTIKVFSFEDKSIDLLKERNDENFKNHMSISTKVSIIKKFNFFTNSVFRVASVIIGGWLFLLKKINIGQIFSIHTYTIQLGHELRNIIELDILLRDIRNSFGRVMDFLHQYDDKTVYNTQRLNSIEFIEFKNVNFQYEQKKLIQDLSFQVERGNVIGIEGKNGSGKTTLTYLLCGFYKPMGIYLNNKSIDKFGEKEILKKVSYVLQNVHLFPATVMENLTCFGDVDEERVYEVCKNIGLHDKIMKFPKGYNTIVNEKNLNLSGGEKQLISLARALLKDSDVLILDEMNSALDSKTEDKLLRNISQYFNNRIIFIISHRKKVFDICDKIINLDQNKVHEKSLVNV